MGNQLRLSLVHIAGLGYPTARLIYLGAGALGLLGCGNEVGDQKNHVFPLGGKKTPSVLRRHWYGFPGGFGACNPCWLWSCSLHGALTTALQCSPWTHWDRDWDWNRCLPEEDSHNRPHPRAGCSRPCSV